MDVTTLDRMRAWMDEKQFSSTSLLNQMITGFSAHLERELGRYLEASERTIYLDVNEGNRVFFLKGYPFSSAPTVYEDTSRAFTGSATSTDDYDITQHALDQGRLEFDYAPSAGPSSIKVVYTGGLAATTAALISAYPDFVTACERQLWWMWKQRGMLGLDGEGGGDNRSRREVVLLTWWQAHGDLLPEVWAALKLYKSYVPRL